MLKLNAEYKYGKGLVLRKARKRHRTECVREWVVGRPKRAWDKGPIPQGHADMIAPGEYYVEDTLVADPFRAGARHCAACALAAGILIGGLKNDEP